MNILPLHESATYFKLIFMFDFVNNDLPIPFMALGFAAIKYNFKSNIQVIKWIWEESIYMSAIATLFNELCILKI